MSPVVGAERLSGSVVMTFHNFNGRCRTKNNKLLNFLFAHDSDSILNAGWIGGLAVSLEYTDEAPSLGAWSLILADSRRYKSDHMVSLLAALL